MSITQKNNLICENGRKLPIAVLVTNNKSVFGETFVYRVQIVTKSSSL